MRDRRNVLLLMSGSIACAKATGLISEWVRRGREVRVACTASAQHFVGLATLEGLSGHPVFHDTFEAGRAMDHIEWARWADLVVACPASAHLINRLSAGLADDAVTTLWQAAWGRGAPLFVVPAMNTRMWAYPATRESVERLASWGVHVLPTANGALACGEHGEGRMLEAAEILERIDGVLDPGPKSGCARILVTGGGTWEPIDAVRYIGNRSTGRTAAGLTDALAVAGHAVTWLGGSSAQRPERAAQEVRFETFEDLDRELRRLLGSDRFDLVVHAAAVSDYSIDRPSAVPAGKLPSGQEISVRLVPNPKLLDRIREYSSNPGTRVVAFKLTAGADASQVEQAVGKLFERAVPDAVVHNDWAEIGKARHNYSLHLPGEPPQCFADTSELATAIGRLLECQGEERDPVSRYRQ